MRTEPSAGQVFAQPMLVVTLARRRADQPVAAVAEIRERHLGDDAAAARSGSNSAPCARASAPYAATMRSSQPGAPGPVTSNFVKPGRSSTATRSWTASHSRAIGGVPGGPTKRGFGARRIVGLWKIHGAFPAAARAESRAFRGKTRVGGRASWPAVRPGAPRPDNRCRIRAGRSRWPWRARTCRLAKSR